MSLLIYIKKYFWRVVLQVIFYGVCFSLIYYFYKWPPPPVKPLVYHKLSLPTLSPVSAVIENYYEVFVNGVATNEVVLFLKDKQGRLWVSAEDVENWRFIKPNVLPITFDGKPFYSLNQFPGLSYQVDEEELTINLHVPVSLYQVNYIDANASHIYKFTPPSPGLFFNYNLFDYRLAGPEGDNLFTGLFQLGMFNTYGVGSTNFINQNAPNTESLLRLTTTWRYDNPDKMWTLSIGDAISEFTDWSSSVNFGGFQWGTNFNTQPQYITFPQPGFRGQATVPSTLDLFINNSMALQQPINPGPYEIFNIPYIDGLGNMRIVTTDIQGRQHVVSFPFYSNTNLLKTGLSNYTYEFGLIRQNLGLTSFDYARFLAAATNSIGINDQFTLQWHLEGLSDQQTAGLTAFKQLSTIGIFNGSMAVSHISAGNEDGGLLAAGFQRQTMDYSFSVNSQITTLYFTQQGLTPGEFSPRLINQATVGTSLGEGSLACVYIRQINRDAPGNNMVSATYSRNIFFDLSLSVTGISNLGGTKNKGVFLSLTRSVGNNTSASLINSIQNDTHQESITLSRGLPQGPGYGYNLVGSTGTSSNTKLASLSLQNDIGTYQAGVIQSSGVTSYNIDVQGGAVYIGGQSYLTRNLNGNSFAVVQTPGFKDVDVYINNQLTAHTDHNGNALIPNLLPYQETPIDIDPNTVPLDAEIDVTSVTVAPYYSSGIIVPFTVKSVQGFTLTLKQSSGSVVPEGAVIKVSDQEEYIVGANGQVYLSDVGVSKVAIVDWENGRCQFAIPTPASNSKNPMPDMGTVICKEVTNVPSKLSVTAR